MAIICPKCDHVRPANASNPDWQCPSCGVCYAKVATARPAASPRVAGATPGWGLPWGKLILLAVFGWAIWTGSQALRAAKDSAPSPAGLSQPDMAALAATVRPEEVVMYSTTECVYCRQAKAWLAQNGFAFKECNMSVSRDCEREFMRYGANGTPFLVVRGQRMDKGFDPDQFLALLQKPVIN